MNIAVDVKAILSPMSKNRGIGYYTTGQLKALFAIDKKNNYFLLNLYEDILLKNIVHYGDNVNEYYFSTGKNFFLWDYPELIGEIFQNFIYEHKIDLFYLTSPVDLSFPLDKSWFKNTKYIVTVYDIIPYIFPDMYLRTTETKEQYNKALDLIINSDNMLAISQSVKNDLMRYKGIEEKKVHVIYAGADAKRNQVIMFSDNDKLQIKKKYGIFDDFILCVGGDDERKNMSSLIEAYSSLSEKLRLKYQIVIVCGLSKSSKEKYYTVAKKNNVADRIVFTNFVPDEDLTKLYNMAYISVFISKYEGFGLPVLESMMCGVPVLTSNNSSLGEIAKDAAILVDPFNIADIFRGLNEILQSTDLNTLRNLGLIRSNFFSWEKTAKLTLVAISSITPHPQQLLHQSLNVLKYKKIAFFTPLPPIKSGISDYSVDIIQQLAKSFSIDIFIDAGYKHNCLFPQNVTVFEHTQFHKRHKEYNKVILQVGNNIYHEYMLEYIKKYNSIVVLHDCNLHCLLKAITCRKHNIKGFRKKSSYDYSKDEMLEMIADIQVGKTSYFDIIVNGFVTNFADIVIVHSKWAIKQILCKNIETNVKHIHLYAKIPNYSFIESNEIKQSAKKKLQIDEQAIVIAAFGFIQETKRSIPSLMAIRHIIQEFPQVKMFYVGEIADEIKDDFFYYITENHLQNIVSVTGFTSIDTFTSYIEASDICLNLRFPYNGETSGTLSRILAAGKCVIVNDIGSFSEIPDESCIKIPSPQDMPIEDETEIIYKALKDLINNPEKRTLLSMNGRKYAEEKLELNKIGQKYIDLMSYTFKKKILTNNMLSQIKSHVKNIENENIFTLSRTLAYSIQERDTDFR
jgi:glycosyltransferase involved in cell wall biosynthesis